MTPTYLVHLYIRGVSGLMSTVKGESITNPQEILDLVLTPFAPILPCSRSTA